jgi:hypothetical protein
LQHGKANVYGVSGNDAKLLDAAEKLLQRPQSNAFSPRLFQQHLPFTRHSIYAKKALGNGGVVKNTRLVSSCSRKVKPDYRG